MLFFRRASAPLLALVVSSVALFAQSNPDFSGIWQQENTRSGQATLHITQHGTDFTVETTIQRPNRPTQHALQRYTTDGSPTTTIGADGDTFVTRILWKDGTLVFSIVEHEDGRTLDSTEIWSLNAAAGTLTRIRHTQKSPSDQTLVYTRVTH